MYSFLFFRSVALVVPNAVEMISLASVNSSITNFEEICRQPSVVAMAFSELKEFAMKHLEKFEIPKQVRIHLVPPNNMVNVYGCFVHLS